jgi:hypothetical protein
MTRKTKKKTTKPRVNNYYVRTGGYNPRYYQAYFFMDFKNKYALNFGGNKVDLSFWQEKRHEELIKNLGWIPVSEEEALKIVIGGFQYAKERYENAP